MYLRYNGAGGKRVKSSAARARTSDAIEEFHKEMLIMAEAPASTLHYASRWF
jgi:hypothetical protein